MNGAACYYAALLQDVTSGGYCGPSIGGSAPNFCKLGGAGTERDANLPGSFSELAGVYAAFLGLTRCSVREPAVAEASLALCERSQGFFLLNASHWGQLAEPDKVNDALVRFL